MKLAKRITTFVLALGLTLSMTSCSSTTWAVKSGDDTIPTGLYLSYLFYTFNNLYNNYYNMGNDVSNFFNEKPNNSTMEQYIMDAARDSAKESIAVTQWLRELGLEIPQEELDSANQTAEDSYEPNADYLTQIGLTKDDIIAYYKDNAAFRTLFNHFFGEGGEKGISLQQLKDDFYENNYRVEIFYVPLKTSTGGSLSEEEQQAIKDRLNGYAKEINEQGATFASIREKEATLTPSVASTTEDSAGYLSKDDVSEDDLVSSTIASLAEGEATAFDFSSYYYVLAQKMPIKSAETDKHVEDYQFSLRYAIAQDEYETMITDRINKTNYSLNNTVLKKYSPRSFLVDSTSSTAASN